MESSGGQQPPAAVAKSAPTYRGTDQTHPLPTCVITPDDLGRLYDDLQRKNYELLEDIARDFKATDELTIDKQRENLRENLRVTVVAAGSKGERIVHDDASGLESKNLPENLSSILIESSWILTYMLNGQKPPNRFNVAFDFSRPPLFDLTNPSGERTPNASHFQVVASNPTWAAGVASDINSWIEARRVRRGWLHGRNTYDVLVLFPGIPMALWGTWRAYGAWVRGSEVESIGIGILVVIYVFLALLNIFRLLFAAAKWLWPYLELQRSNRGARRAIRVSLITVFVGVITAVVYDVLRMLVHR